MFENRLTNLSIWNVPGLAVLLVIFLSYQSQITFSQTADLEISPDGHFLLNRDRSPFYWIGDTGWAMFQQLTRAEVDSYLDDRQARGFTIIQSVAFWFPHGVLKENGPLNAANAYGHRPFAGEANAPSTSTPQVIPGGGALDPNDYWDHADYVVEAVKKRGLKLVLLPCWGNAFINNRMPGSRIVFSEVQANQYGHFLGQRYRNESHIIWCLGGDVDPVNFGDRDQRSVYRAMAEGIGRGVSGNPHLSWNAPDADWDKTLITFHAVRTPKLSGEGAEGGSSSLWFHDDAWLDFNMMETFRWMHKIYPYVSEDYQKYPTKPTVLGEGAYEMGRYKNDCGHITPLKVRRQGYHAFFAGAAGYTYGHWSIWPFRGAYCEVTWQEALNAPGAFCVAKILKNFLVEQEIESFVPDQTLIQSTIYPGELRQCAMIKNDSKIILLYLPENKAVKVNLSRLPADGPQIGTWFDPRSGDRKRATVLQGGIFEPPQDWEDAVLILKKGE